MDDKTYLERKNLREKLQANQDWPDIQKYADSQATKAINSHDSKLSSSNPVYKKSLELYRVAVDKAIEAKLNPAIFNVLFLKFISIEDIDSKINALKNIKKYYL